MTMIMYRCKKFTYITKKSLITFQNKLKSSGKTSCDEAKFLKMAVEDTAHAQRGAFNIFVPGVEGEFMHLQIYLLLALQNISIIYIRRKKG